MADPVTWGLAIGAVVSAAGAIASSAASANQAQAQSQAAEFNAAVAGQNATLARQQAAVDAANIELQGDRKRGAVRAAAAASGLTGGSVSDILADVATTNELEVLLTKYKGDVAATGFTNTATLDRARADSFITRAGEARTAGYLSAGGMLVKGGVDVYDQLEQG